MAAPAHALRCNGRLVHAGDHVLQAREHCGEPYWIDRHSEWLILGEGAALERRIERKVEVWFYNFGSNRFMQRLVFRDDRLVAEEQLGYGYSGKSRSCDVDSLPAGISNGEIVARCGAPYSSSDNYADVLVRDGAGNAELRVQRIEEWVYERQGRDPILLRLVDGRLAETERIDL